ncbi:bone morphogenetic protein 15 [Thalassophryne amazonica]|uniref:bone morphogenetic protein 15 n=1 Tax=Thalassophryne amazonica TaxID=390379 RepID=UPI001470E50B|nr:bone morphogenetic protein 15 [Thalassophryne amazonica]
MRASRSRTSFLLTCVLFVVCSVSAGAGSGRRMASHHLHRPLTDEQRADQNLHFMLSLYRSAAEPDGRPKQHRKFGSNTVRLVRPSASSVRHLPARKDHHYTFTVQYNLDTLPSEQLIRASFVHLRSSSTAASHDHQALQPPRCRAKVTSLGKESLVTLEPHEQWTETDITAHISGHVLQGRTRGLAEHLNLTAQYWCTEQFGGRSWWLARPRARKRWYGETHVEVPSLLLYLEEEREVKDWMGELFGAEGEKILEQIRQWHPTIRRRRSKDSSPSVDVLKNAPAISSSIISDIPTFKRKTSMPKNRCKLHSFRLSFDELGWSHYFIAPPMYNPRFCQGDCPRVLHYGYHSPNHAIIQTIINDLGVGDVPPPSCVPYKYMPMSVLVVHKKKVEYKELDDMVAESCTCR